MAKKAAKINIALDDVYAIALSLKGWNVDDFNHTKDPFITMALVANQRDYHFTYDGETSLILGIQRVMCRDSATGTYVLLNPVDQQSDNDMALFYDGNNTTGIPTRYDKTGNGIFLDPIPSYASSDGLKVFINRQPSYFTSSDTTKIAGVDGLCQDYLYLKPAYEYARDNGLPVADRLYRDLLTAKEKIYKRYANREQDVKKKFTFNVENNK